MTQNNHSKLNDPVIKALYDELENDYNCHTIILYGSRAIGKETYTSDYDLAGICKNGSPAHIARYDSIHKVFVSVFIYPEKDLFQIKKEHLIMYKGIVLKEEAQFGSSLLKKINALALSPVPLKDSECEIKIIWYKKMLIRSKIPDANGAYRRIWIINNLIQDYFAFRNLHYLGPKKSFEYLRIYDIKTFRVYELLLNNIYNDKLLEELINIVLEKKQEEVSI